MKRNCIRVTGYLFILLFLLSINCSNKKKKEIDVLSDCLIRIEQQKASLECNRKKNDSYFTKGWSNAEMSGRWALGTDSEVKFYLINEYIFSTNSSIAIYGVFSLKCSESNQKVDAFINGNYVGSHYITTVPSDYAFDVQSNYLTKEWNTVRFHFSQSCRPDSFGKKDSRSLSAFFSKIAFSFSDDTSYGKNKIFLSNYGYNGVKLYQLPSNTGIEIYLPFGKKHIMNLLLKIDCASFSSRPANINWELAMSQPLKKELLRKTFVCGRKETTIYEKEIQLNNENPGIPILQMNAYEPLKNGTIKLSASLKLNYSYAEIKKKPNIILFIFDALRYDHVHFSGYSRPTTPNLDETCKESLFFKRAYSQAPFTIHSIGSLLTSQYPFWNPGERLPSEHKTIAEILKNNGYYTILMSKSPFITETYGTARGFDYIKERALISDSKGIAVIKNFRLNELVLPALSQGVNSGHPFFMYVHLDLPHAPYIPPNPFRSKFRSKNLVDPTIQFLVDLSLSNDCINYEIDSYMLQDIIDQYDGNVLYADEMYGDFVYLLKKLNLYNDNLLLVVTSDHGEELLEHNNLMHSETLFEELIHVPLIIHYSPLLKAAHIEKPVELIDISPTILSLIGIPGIKQTYDMEGDNIIDLLTNDKKNKEAYSVLFHENTMRAVSIVMNNKKIIRCFDGTLGLARGLHKCDTCAIDLKSNTKEECLPLPSSDFKQLIDRLNRWTDIERKNHSNFVQEKAYPSKEEIEQLKALGYIK